MDYLADSFTGAKRGDVSRNSKSTGTLRYLMPSLCIGDGD
jgi:hypothetical protein